MGCFQSKTANVVSSPDHSSLAHRPESVTENQVHHEDQTDHENHHEDQVEQENQVPCFREFTLRELYDATNGFSSKRIIVSEGRATDTNLVYRGQLEGYGLVVAKQFSRWNWPNAQQFVDLAIDVGKLRSKRLVNLIGYSVEANQRWLVAEYMPHGSLSKHLFQWEKQEMPWEMRVRVAYYIAQALEYCNVENKKIYHGLEPSRIFFDEEGDPRLSTFGLIKNRRYGGSYSTNLTYSPPEFSETGRVIPESVIYSYGTVLIDLVSGKHIPPNHACDIIKEKKELLLIDSSLEGRLEIEDAAKLLDLASKCLQHMPKDRPDAKFLVTETEPLQKQKEVSSHFLMSLPNITVRLPNAISPLRQACSRMDHAAVHEILLKTGYNDETQDSDFPFTQQVQELLEAKNLGDKAFRDKDFVNAINFYSKLVSMMSKPYVTVLARRSFSYLVTGDHDRALRDALQAQFRTREWPTPFYLQSLALWKFGMERDANNMINVGAELEAKRLQREKRALITFFD